MGRSFGAGSPIYFLCPVARRNREMWGQEDRSRSGRLPDGHDVIVRTGKTKPRQRGKAIGTRQMHTSHEYRCECGHVGWTTHRLILRYPLAGHSDECEMMVRLLTGETCTCGYDS